MRPLFAIGAFGVLGLLVLTMNTGGRLLMSPRAAPIAPDPVAEAPSAIEDDAAAKPPLPTPPRPGPARPVSPAIVAPPPLDTEILERVEPREPLSDIGLAMPPKPVRPDDWEGTVLYRPVATGSAMFEAMGRTVAISGVANVAPDQVCTFEGREWACGIRARTAFRLFVRGRALVCAVPPEAEKDLIVAECRIGKQNVGAWLVENGWAEALADGPYAEAGAQAKSDKKGMFGPPPDMTN